MRYSLIGRAGEITGNYFTSLFLMGNKPAARGPCGPCPAAGSQKTTRGLSFLAFRPG
ncbi:hypothetical protein HMP0721_2416 [Pseudoramibacter alactolyticus ATCC 23263]|uniref:Uncharacterized protein n=1 Tax=Pseudoramibacter alactolyticus ATCC 23263 TaxID=887929 RepID=E6MK80_9FIRM|nr:hypothetical protein HMP0721_2416 [Pseudoramibacter alactolyticus ATCC 23263]